MGREIIKIYSEGEKKMTRQEFNEKIRSEFEARLKETDPEASVVIKECKKNNGVVREGIEVRGSQNNIHPLVYIDGAYEMSNTNGFDTTFEQLWETYRENVPENTFDVSQIMDYEVAKNNLSVCVVNAQMNEERLGKAPHEVVGDLAVLYRIDVSNLNTPDGGMGTVLVSNDILKQWGVSEDTLKADAWKSQRQNHPYTVRSMKEVMIDMFCQNGNMDMIDAGLLDALDAEAPQMYILSNKDTINGAVYMCDKDVMSEVASRLGDNLIVLPSSIHECIIIKEDGMQSLDELKDMVETVNNTEVSATDKLSDNVYTFDRLTQELTVYDGQSQNMSIKM